MSEGNERLLLLLTDILGDLGIKQAETLWTPEAVTKALKKKVGGLELASEMVARLTGSTDKKSQLKSWNGLMEGHASLCPPWLSKDDLSKKAMVSKLEILSFLASTLQNRMLKQKTSNQVAKTSNATKRKNDTPQSSHTEPNLSLPSHLTAQQREIVLECYIGLKQDYDKRRVGMKQRLDILVSNFEADNADDKDMAEVKKKIQSLSLSSSLPVDLSEVELLAHFKTPHSKGLGSRTPVPRSGASNPLENLMIVDRGGRTDEAESRISMPKWAS